MKRFLALLCCLLLTALAACSGGDTTVSSSESTAQAETTSAPSSEEKRIAYKGLSSAAFTTEDMAAAEGREPDFVTDNAGVTLYIYNDVTLEDLTFTQVQYTYGEDNNRISCTYTAESGLETVLEACRSSMSALYGAPAERESPVSYAWQDSFGNYVLLSQLNETTVQLVFYLCEGAA